MDQSPSGQNETYHEILAKSYLVYFIFSAIALFIDSRLNIRFSFPLQSPLAVVCLAVGPLLILWAQLTSLKTVQGKQRLLYFGKGPYKYMRNPTQLGILILIAGYTLVSGSLVFFGVSVIAYFVSNRYFKEYEQALKQDFGEHYEQYEEKVSKVL
jgi:protein-S-isoprenylcysteine O-methyltransferase Ste14